MVTLYGESVYKDICIGKLSYYGGKESTVTQYQIEDSDSEIANYKEASQKAVEQLKMLYDKAIREVGEDSAAIFEAHRMMLEDSEYQKAIETLISTEKVNAAYAISVTGKKFAKMFQNMDNDYMRERAVDVQDVSDRLIKTLSNETLDGNKFDEPVIIAARDLTPSDTLQFPKEKLLGFMLEQGSANSHTAILARSMGIPALISVQTLCMEKYDGHQAILDGENSVVYIDPDEETFSEYEKKVAELSKKKKKLQSLKGKETITRSGRKIRLYANAGNLMDVDNAVENDAEGIGLFRSEFLYLENSDFPTEEQQFEAYKQVLEKMGDRQVIIRTLDIGADKKTDYFKLDDEENPAMGYRALRICLTRPEIFKTQLRALYRAGCYGNLAIMIPMVISLEEIQMVREIILQVQQELKQEGKPYKENVELGIMIETPAAALISDKLAKEVDFFSIGTNDLSQYTMAIDRQNQNLQHFFNPHHEAVFKLIEMSIQAIHNEGKWVGICGELGADFDVTQKLIEMGIDEFSVSPGILLEMRKKIRES
ncbi:MAG: phosphoenolpyruvate--protein phosphotransferase [Lachnospiraceae bacterium]|nr:phosphoenolpyruvate--protein phosphotransferase [Lachnospiraceae bacterium]